MLQTVCGKPLVEVLTVRELHGKTQVAAAERRRNVLLHLALLAAVRNLLVRLERMRGPREHLFVASRMSAHGTTERNSQSVTSKLWAKKKGFAIVENKKKSEKLKKYE